MLYQHATFITADLDPAESVADITMENTQMGLLAFVRLVGCAYFKKHLTRFRLQWECKLLHIHVWPYDVHVCVMYACFLQTCPAMDGKEKKSNFK